MTIRERSAVMGIIAAMSLILYGAARFNSHLLVEHVVERTLIQKAPAGTDPVKIRQSFQALLAAAGDRSARTDMLFGISQELEKVQVLSPQALAEILKIPEPEILNN